MPPTPSSRLPEDTSPEPSRRGLLRWRLPRWEPTVPAMAFLDTKRDRAAFLIFVLGIGLVWALWPFSTGLIGAPGSLRGVRPGLPMAGPLGQTRDCGRAWSSSWGSSSSSGPGVSFVGVVAGEAQDIASGVIRSPLLSRLRELRVGPYDVGAQIETAGSRLVTWIGTSALGLIGTATRPGHPAHHRLLRPVLPAPGSADRPGGGPALHPLLAPQRGMLRDRFRDVTISTLIGTGLTAAVQGLLVGLAFWVTGIPERSILGCGDDRSGDSAGGGKRTGMGSRRCRSGNRRITTDGDRSGALGCHRGRQRGQHHPADGIPAVGPDPSIHHHHRGVCRHQYFGLLGLLIGPLAISYFFELIRMYRAEHLEEERSRRYTASTGLRPSQNRNTGTPSAMSAVPLTALPGLDATEPTTT